MVRREMISIIVPVYNAESYLEQCIKSVLAQSNVDLELILVDDGSTDGSLKICRRWENDSRVSVISTENRGVSAARNLGLQKASGKWILFLDSDDYLLDNCLENLMAMVSPDTQAVIAAYTDGRTGNEKVLHQPVSANAVCRMTLDAINNSLMPEFYEVKPLSLSACWAKLFLNEVIRKNGLCFNEDLRLSEDTLFNLDYLACVDTVVVSNLPVIYYRQHNASVTKTFDRKHLKNRFCYFDILKERNYPDAAVHILSLLFFEICKMERYTNGQERKLPEKEVAAYLCENMDILRRVRNVSLSGGKWQRLVYRAAAGCFRYKAYWAGFALLRCYAAATQGKLSD